MKLKKTLVKKRNDNALWLDRFKELLSKYHKRNIDKLANKLLAKTARIKCSMTSRSKQYNVKCDITTDDIRELVIEYYGKPCKYEKSRIILYNNMVFDHIIPISKGGESTKSNIQVISRFANNMKGSLDEKSFLELKTWLDSVDPELRKDVSIRLAHGMH